MISKKVYRRILNFFYVIVFMMIISIAALPKGASAGNVAVISSKDVKVSRLGQDEVKQIFLGRKTRWSDDRKIKFVILKSGNAHKEFLRSYVKKTPSQFRTFWKKMIFTGKGRAPKSFNSPDELLKFVAETPGAIGYIPEEKKSESVNVISVN